MSTETKTTDFERAASIAKLHAAIDWLEAHPLVPLPTTMYCHLPFNAANATDVLNDFVRDEGEVVIDKPYAGSSETWVSRPEIALKVAFPAELLVDDPGRPPTMLTVEKIRERAVQP